MDTFDQFISDLTAGDADLHVLRAVATKGPAKKFKTNAQPATMPKRKPAMTRTEKTASLIEAFDADTGGLYSFLKAATWSDFAQSLAAGVEKYGSLTDRQLAAATSMRLKVEGRDEAPAAPAAKSRHVAGFGEVVALMDHIQGSGAKYPRVRIQTRGGLDFIITRKMSGKFAGTDSINLGNSTQGPWLGGVSQQGSWTPSRIAGGMDAADKADLWETMQELQADPKAVFARNGKELGRCACCGRPLSDQESVARGIGPECWGKL